MQLDFTYWLEQELGRKETKATVTPTHTFSFLRPKPPLENLWSVREKVSINTSVGLPWLQHVTVSLFTPCVNLLGLVCAGNLCISLSSAGCQHVFFSLSLALVYDFTVHNWFSVSPSCWKPAANMEMEYRVILQTDWGSTAISSGVEPCTRIDHQGSVNIPALRHISYELTAADLRSVFT